MTDDSHPDSDRPDSQPTASSITYPIDADEKPSQAVVRAVSALTNVRPLELDPLYDTIDPAHLDGILAEQGIETDTSNTELSFEYHDCEVTVTTSAVVVRKCDTTRSK